MRTRVIQDEPKPREAALPAAEAEQDADEQTAVGEQDAPEQNVEGVKP
jgi:hypothetical protein